MTEETSEQEKTGVLSALKGMVSFFTLFHLDITKRDMDSMEERFHLVPIVGAVYSLITLIIVSLGLFVLRETGMGSPLMIGIFCLASVYIFSKFLHFDGMTDFGDGMIVSGRPEDHVRALKDSLVGAGGIGVALTVVLISVGIYSVIPLVAMAMVVPVTEILVKFAMVVAAARGKPGHGMAGRQVELTTGRSIVYALVIAAVLAAVFWVAGMSVTDSVLGYSLGIGYGQTALVLVLGFVAAAVVACLMARTANRNFDMVNGDILGATNEISRPVIMFVMTLAVYALVI